MNRDDNRRTTSTAAEPVAGAMHGTGERSAHSDTAPDPAPDPIITAVRRTAGFLREGWSFTTRLAERMPRAYFAGWSL
ncbi:hypothetical protein [Nocardia carnea]|uniref:Uncharacterized protein n=1 Tax=Nocardia carnea TaxID=37328 RepID=A0ABW7TW71_9NOCA|nr:hypothetical protein [Nocardia carnea]